MGRGSNWLGGDYLSGGGSFGGPGAAELEVGAQVGEHPPCLCLNLKKARKRERTKVRSQ